MNIRAYTASDRDACLSLFDSNTPLYFAAAERPDFEAFLNAAPGPYSVAIAPEGLLACGGWARDRNDSASAVLCWGMVQNAQHRKGLGAQLLRARLDQIRAAGIARVTLSTSQHSAGFFARFGFVERRRVADGHAPGIDLVDMALTI